MMSTVRSKKTKKTFTNLLAMIFVLERDGLGGDTYLPTYLHISLGPGWLGCCCCCGANNMSLSAWVVLTCLAPR